MAICRKELKMTGIKFRADLIIAVRLVLLVLLAATSLSAFAADIALSQQDQQCLSCHGTKGLEKKLANKETLALYVEGEAFAKSVHNLLGCAVCHRDVALEKHPPLKKKIASLRENSLELTKVCRSCHAGIFKL
jgi:hypothetical protein